MMRQYLEMPHLERIKHPLEFWKKYKQTFPELYKINLKYLCVPATSVPSERVFSKTGQITNDRRNRLSPKNLDYIIFLNSNLNLF
ncbi:zinc finger BED domain-containing protein 1-like [Aphis craccivora]|uniref:Zinc finger BED domain-containing protein 1-like n=1 Tax=Aphis craccivora TaxID=307492 RepID=A0A6G0VQS2_APHCR|nr:zinc finger BED domain-containing protein 1-like [Aphis craccivora]